MKASHYAWAVVGLLWFVWLLNYLDRQVIFSVFPPLQRDLGLSSVELGLLGTSFLWVYAIFSPFSGFLADRYGRKQMVVASLFVWSLLTWVTGHIGGFTGLLAVRAAMGLSEACYLPAGLAMIANFHGNRTRSFATGLHYSGGYLGTVLGGFLGGWAAEHYGWRSIFGLLGAVGVAYSLIMALVLREAPVSALLEGTTEQPRLWRSLRELFSLPGFGIMMLVFAAVSIGDWAIYTWMPVYLYERFHMSLTSAGFSATFYAKAGGFTGILLGGFVADRLSGQMQRGRLLTQACGLIMAAPFLIFAGITTSSLSLIIALFLFGMGKGSYDCNTMPVLAQIARPNLRSTGFGMFNFGGCIAGGAIAVIGGGLKNSLGLGVTFQAAGVLLLLSGLVLLRTRIREVSVLSPVLQN